MATAIERLERIWSEPKGLSFDLATVDHKRIGARYMATAFGFFTLAGLMALAMRAQLTLPNLKLLSAEQYNQFFTMHGTTMIFFFATPMLFGFGNFLVPLMIGARDMAYPRLNAFGYWVFLFAGFFMFSSFFLGSAPDGGWFAYVPLTGPVYSPPVNIDFWAMGLVFLRHRHDRWLHQLHRDHLQNAGAGHDREPDPAVRLGNPGDVLRGDVRAAASDHG